MGETLCGDARYASRPPLRLPLTDSNFGFNLAVWDRLLGPTVRNPMMGMRPWQ